MKKLVIFDIDGTLHNTIVMSKEAHRIVMPEFGLPEPPTEILQETFGCDTKKILQILGIKRCDHQAFLKRINEEETRQIYACGVCYEGVVEMLHRLYEEGYLMALCSMCTPEYRRAFLARFGLEGLFACCRDEKDGTEKGRLLRQILQEIKPDRAIMVGDRCYDIIAAHQVQIPCIGCAYGYAPSEAQRADYVVEHSSGLYETLSSVWDR